MIFRWNGRRSRLYEAKGNDHHQRQQQQKNKTNCKCAFLICEEKDKQSMNPFPLCCCYSKDGHLRLSSILVTTSCVFRDKWADKQTDRHRQFNVRTYI